MRYIGRAKQNTLILNRNEPSMNHRVGIQTWSSNKPNNIKMRLNKIKGCNSSSKNNKEINDALFCNNSVVQDA